uniref:Uncharacterized protein n=1 Tax=Anguilla anguilla TaxID=7936 RepID=A0A0E9Q666_ANGAN
MISLRHERPGSSVFPRRPKDKIKFGGLFFSLHANFSAKACFGCRLIVGIFYLHGRSFEWQFIS